jgi:hypothetical protein
MGLDGERRKLSQEQVALMYDVLSERPQSLRSVAERVARFEVIPQADADELASALTDAMLSEADREGDLSDLALKLDEIIGIVYQASEDFFH